MQQELISWQIPLDYCLELVIAFNDRGRVVYANQTAQETLEYSSEDKDVTIYEIFPGVFTESEHGFVTELILGRDIHDVNVYRKNRTFFHAEARIFPAMQTGIYICMAKDISKQETPEHDAFKITHLK